MEFLKEILGDGYSAFESAIKAYNDKNKDKPIKLANLTAGDYVSKDKFTALETTKTELENQIKDRDKQLEDLKKVDAAGLQAEITRLQGENTKAKTDFETKLKQTQLEYALEAKLIREGAVNTKAVKALLDSSKISLDGENIVGLDDQLKTLKETEKWAFTPQTIIPGAGGNPADPPKVEDTANKPVVDRVANKMSTLFNQ